jgi:hypothetical protein
VVTMMIMVVIIQEPQKVAAVTSFLQCHRRMKRLQSTLNGNASGTTAARGQGSQTRKLQLILYGPLTDLIPITE